MNSKRRILEEISFQEDQKNMLICIRFNYYRFDQNKVEYKQPIYKEKNRFSKIDKEKHKVFTDPRNILTNPMKRGTSSYPK